VSGYYGDEVTRDCYYKAILPTLSFL